MNAQPEPTRARVLHEFRLVLPWPPTVNTYWRHPATGKLAGRHLISVKGREYRGAVAAVVAREFGLRLWLIGPLAVTIHAWPPDRRKRDLDNLPKGVLDALTHAGFWADDSQIDWLTIRREPRSDGGHLIVVVTELGWAGAQA